MIDIVEVWLNSGQYAEIAGQRLRPIESKLLKGTPLATVRGQAQAFYLRDDNSIDWILKKFSPGKIPDSSYINAIQPLIPRRPGFQSGYLRKIFKQADVQPSGFYSDDFASWIENTVLMARVKCDDWAGLADNIRSGLVVIGKDERLLFCKSLSEHISELEHYQMAHRDLSSTNVFVSRQNVFVHLIDWECIHHPTLTMPINTVFGSEGYIAPFVKRSGQPDAQATWRERADRFSMALLNVEFLCMQVGSPVQHDGGIFDQSDLYNRGGRTIDEAVRHLRQNFPDVVDLFERNIQAQDFDDCPAPDEWLTVVTAPHQTIRAVKVQPAGVPPPLDPPPKTASLVLLNESAFVPLDTSAFVQLIQ